MDKFIVCCIGGYKDKKVIGYFVMFVLISKYFGLIINYCLGKELEIGFEKEMEIDFYRFLVFLNWSILIIMIILFVGDLKEDYSVWVKIEVKYLLMFLFFDDVVVKVGWFVRKI